MNLNEVLNRFELKLIQEIIKVEIPLTRVLIEDEKFNEKFTNKSQLIEIIANDLFDSFLSNQKYLVLLVDHLCETEVEDFSLKIFDDYLDKAYVLKILSDLNSLSLDLTGRIKDYFKVSKGLEIEKEITQTYLSNDEVFYELLDYQFIIKSQVLSILESDRVVPKMIIHMPTGTGKTKTMNHTLVYHYVYNLKKKGIVIWLAHTIELIDQAFQTFSNVWRNLGKGGINVNISDVSNLDSDSQILFMSYQKLISLSKRNPEIFNMLKANVCMIIADEAHKCLAPETSKALGSIMIKGPNDYNKSLIGLTATPGRKLSDFDDEEENESLSILFEKTIITVDINTLNNLDYKKAQNIKKFYENVYEQDQDIINYFQNREILSNIQREELIYVLNSDESKSFAEAFKRSSTKDFDYKALNNISNIIDRNRIIIQKLYELGSMKSPTIVFACSVDHGKFIEICLKILGIRVAGVYGVTEKNLRKQIIDDFNNAKYDILVNFEVLTTGFDSPRIQNVFITRPTKSIVLYSQMLGRGLRGPKMGGNKTCQLIDIQDNLDRFSNENEAFRYFEEYWR